MATLKVYKASAGSGKTFRLTASYISLLIENPSNYKHILAVTFTNKATEEMKMRILQHLYGIANALPDSNSYFEELKESNPNIDEKKIRENARKALGLLLHDYNMFQVVTIDSFFQRVLKNLARELGLTSNFCVSLNELQIEQQAVDDLVNSLDKNSKVLQWISNNIENRMREGKGWNIFDDLKRFGQQVLKEIYKENKAQLKDVLENDKSFYEYKNYIKGIKFHAEQCIKNIATEFFNIITPYGYTESSFSYGKSGVYSYFNNIQNGIYESKIYGERVKKAFSDENAWVKSSDKDKDIKIDFVRNNIIWHCEEWEKNRKEHYPIYITADIILKNLDNLRLLHKIERQIEEINHAENRIFLSDTQSLLKSLIEGNDAPFIYEKIGSQLKYIMIDEFQDTSNIQWENFKVLLLECMSKNSGNMIVGDIKQSIYRWRDGDWRILADIETKEDFSNNIDIINMNCNWRSSKNVIDFNNKFFELAVNKEVDNFSEIQKCLYKNAYSDVKQKLPDNKLVNNGLVEVKLFSKGDDKKNKEYNKTPEDVYELVANQVKKLIEKGAKLSSIAIISRKNKVLTDIVEYFQLHKINIKLISNEAFHLSSSLAVNMIIYALTSLYDKTNEIVVRTLVYNYHNFILKSNKSVNELFLEDTSDLLPKEFVEQREDLLTLPLNEVAERIFKIFQLYKLEEQSAFIYSFFDELSEFIKNNVANLGDFLKEWKNNICDKSIESTSNDGVSMMTIHKSKGLEFDNVIIPIIGWTDINDEIWCKIPNTLIQNSNQINNNVCECEYKEKENTISTLPIMPLKTKKELNESFYKDSYEEELFQRNIDNMNLLYVALTRAKNNLFIYGLEETKNYRSRIFFDIYEDLKEKLTSINIVDKHNIDFSFGELYISEKDNEKINTKNVFNQKEIGESVDFGITNEDSSKNRDVIIFRQSQSSRLFLKEDVEDKILYGNLMHEILSKVEYKYDLKTIIKQYETDGIISIKEANEITDLLERALNNDLAESWFNDKWTVFNEQPILTRDSMTEKIKEYRPDRIITNEKETIVIDFKFGDIENNKYINQVKGYIKLLEDLDFPNVKGYVWFIKKNIIKEVN